jgi:hypothetical protein
MEIKLTIKGEDGREIQRQIHSTIHGLKDVEKLHYSR